MRAARRSRTRHPQPLVPPEAVEQGRKIAVLVRTLDQLDAALACRPAMVYCDFEDVRRYTRRRRLARAAGVPIGLATLRILKPGEEGFLRQHRRLEPDAVLVRNLAGA